MSTVELEFKRIQTYLFSSPRLKAMLGANSVLGRTIRIKLVELAKEHDACADSILAAKLPTKNENDPINSAEAINPLLVDNPQKIYLDYGVLVRDGGHFTATFPKDKANNFLQAATKLVTENLPGILINARIDGKETTVDNDTPTGESLFHHPAFQVSHHQGNAPASERQHDHFVSHDEKEIEEAGKKFREEPTDIIAALENQKLIPTPENRPESLNELAGNHHLALIHADGNSIGARYKAWQNQAEKNGRADLEKEIHGEKFFHSMRVAVRAALCQALNEVFAEAPASYQLLMLGGDDLLMACAAPYAFEFSQAYAKALTAKELELADGKPLTIGIGVAIAKPSFPFYRLHTMAEELASSAKQLYRANESVGSVIDWHITSNSWVNDPIAQRKEANQLGDWVFSNKPYAVIGENQFTGLLAASNELLRKDAFARSQVRHLVECLRLGQTQAELAWYELPEKLQKVLSEILTSFGYEKSKLYKYDGKLGIHQCLLADLIELAEIQIKKAKQETNIERTEA